MACWDIFACRIVSFAPLNVALFSEADDDTQLQYAFLAAASVAQSDVTLSLDALNNRNNVAGRPTLSRDSFRRK